MKFDSWQAFVDMGGYGFFVWLSYGATFLLVVGLIAASLMRHKQVKQNIEKKLQREQDAQQRQ